MHLKQFAYYSPETSNTKRDVKPSIHERRHFHAQRHVQKRALGDWITATINGQVVSWKNNYDGSSAAMTTQANAPVITATVNGEVVSWTNNYGGASATTTQSSTLVIPTPSPSLQDSTTARLLSVLPFSSQSTASASSVAAGTNQDAGDWARQAYYEAETPHADGLVFLNNHGGVASGVFDLNFGMSLSYASSDSKTAAASPQVLADALLDDSTEVSIWTDKQCQSSDCGYYRPGAVAYHGFDGSSKLFLMEFDMPCSNYAYPTAANPNPNMPAIWALNANIARTEQYGSCSCFPGCGEWDIFEIDTANDMQLASCVHANLAGCDEAWFQRPVNKTMKAAVLFDGSNSAGHIYVLPDGMDFSTTISSATVAGFGTAGNAGTEVVSRFVAKVYNLATGAQA